MRTTLLLLAAVATMTLASAAGDVAEARPGFSPPAWPEPACVRAYGKIACGYHCQAAYGQVRCAQSPYGTCRAWHRQVKCWDPSRRDLQIAAHRGAISQAECKVAFGRMECGYGCTNAYNQLRCAKSPGATCKAAYGQIACGFGCESAYGQVRCAERAGGACFAEAGRLTCAEGYAF